ncbi:serine acetyltransferase [Rhodococcus sp. BP-349]|uniref:serine acetyltransferase n=1 Tax=unclassified Rhodococcus (in: high G+C Gram-positive bacteria) TaxID=192944 RepID=UPI001C9AB456|nr:MULTISPECIES: serine acetyltransferase [unclassified Rhodococcus (in: high G+C Gram-positive bacteria)]MBY6539482.1 serine acetyltransferase [Rhodococcus sp. BP-363]MBY6544190.1 serine acetyltransferase [Rhodococcus sp. BP-369]MBY6563420.1 serine acetyltransferase [Rhodococcus sp. BP-370]MBY6577712.1 serine acetyltransferase [Rhodococcus sp. BP-364]MBY6587013.1 serine acetyltransferase [Rhodococcus sp. BP-358]
MALTRAKAALLPIVAVGVLPMRAAVRMSGSGALIAADVARWVDCIDRDIVRELSESRQFDYLVSALPEFRCLLRHRTESAPRWVRVVVSILYRHDRSMVLDSPEIGPGFFIQHGNGMKVSAERIGSNCFINQWATVGYTDHGRPTIGDDVRIGPGAVVVGPVTLHDGCRIGPNVVIVEDVPAGTIMTAAEPVARIRRTHRT